MSSAPPLARPPRLCVFCGSSAGARPDYAEAAAALGAEIARRGIGLVYGGAKVGLMGIVADALEQGRWPLREVKADELPAAFGFVLSPMARQPTR